MPCERNIAFRGFFERGIELVTASAMAARNFAMKKSLIFALLLIGTCWLAHGAPDEAEGYKPVITATPLLRASTTAGGQPISYPATDHPEVVAVRVEICTSRADSSIALRPGT